MVILLIMGESSLVQVSLFICRGNVCRLPHARLCEFFSACSVCSSSQCHSMVLGLMFTVRYPFSHLIQYCNGAQVVQLTSYTCCISCVDRYQSDQQNFKQKILSTLVFGPMFTVRYQFTHFIQYIVAMAPRQVQPFVLHLLQLTRSQSYQQKSKQSI